MTELPWDPENNVQKEVKRLTICQNDTGILEKTSRKMQWMKLNVSGYNRNNQKMQ